MAAEVASPCSGRNALAAEEEPRSLPERERSVEPRRVGAVANARPYGAGCEQQSESRPASPHSVVIVCRRMSKTTIDASNSRSDGSRNKNDIPVEGVHRDWFGARFDSIETQRVESMAVHARVRQLT